MVIYIKSHLTVEFLEVSYDQDGSMEAVCCRLKQSGTPRLTEGCVYRSSDSQLHSNTSETPIIKNLIQRPIHN